MPQVIKKDQVMFNSEITKLYHSQLVFAFAFLATTLGILLLVPRIAYASITNTRVDGAGTVELSGASWLGGGGVDIFSNGNSAGNVWGDNCVPVTGAPGDSHCSAGDVFSGSKWQCAEMINRLYLTNRWITSTWYGNGNTLVSSVPAGLTKQNNGMISSLNTGDVITLDDGNDGHAAIINSVGGNVQIVNQNTVAVYSTASISSGSLNAGDATLTMSGWAGYNVQAIVHRPPDADTDHDGIPDGKDDCPAKAGVAGNPYYGCPAYIPGSSNYALTNEIPVETAMSSWGNGRLDVFKRNPDDTVSHKFFDNGIWSDWGDSLGGNIVGKPGAVSWGWGRIDVFGIGPDGKLKHVFIDNNQGPWSPWETLDYLPNDSGCLKEGVNVSTWGQGRLDIEAEGCDNTARHLWLNNNQWQSWDNLGGCIQGPPTSASWGPNRLDVFVRGCDNVLYTKIVDQNGWSGWAGMGGCLSSAPGVTSPGFQRLDVFARGCAKDELLHEPFRVANGVGQWLPWDEWGGNIAQAPTATSWGTSRFDVVSTGADGSIQQFYFDRAWPASGWAPL